MNKKIVSLVILCVIFLAGCGRQYQVKPLKHVRKTEANFVEKKENIELRVKKLDRTEVKQLFNNQYIANRQVTALLTTIKNDTTKPITIDQKTLGISLVSYERLLAALSRSTYSKIIPGICALPLVGVASFGVGAVALKIADACGAFATYTGGTIIGPALLIFSSTALISTGIGISIVVGTTTYAILDAKKFNSALAADLKRKVLTSQTIAPGEKESALLFAKNLPESFTITLLKGQEKVPFTVTLKIPENPKTTRQKTKK